MTTFRRFSIPAFHYKSIFSDIFDKRLFHIRLVVAKIWSNELVSWKVLIVIVEIK